MQDTSFFLLERLHSKLERVKSGEYSFILDGSLKLFGFTEPSSFPLIITPNQENYNFNPNHEQQIAILKSLSQEVTFIWGPPGTGKTRTLTLILNLLIKAGKKVLLATNTNAALDEILRKFLDSPENVSFIEDGKIIRLGIPTFEHEKLAYIVPERRKIFKKEGPIQVLENDLEALLKTIKEYDLQEKVLIEKIQKQESLKQECDLIQQEINTLRKRIENSKRTLESNRAWLCTNKQLLEKAKNASILRRFFSGINTDHLENQVKTIENQNQINNLEILSFQNKIEELTLKKDMRQSNLREPLFEDPKSQTAFNLAKIEQKISDLEVERKEKESTLTSLNTTDEKSRNSIIKDALVIGTTIARACVDSNISQIKFDTLIIDEASMALLPNVFFLSGLCSNHYIISGDFRQLSPIAEARTPLAQKWLRRDIFDQAGIVERVNLEIGDNRLVMLREQFRMHPCICNLVSEVVYDGKLVTPDSVVPIKEKIAALVSL